MIEIFEQFALAFIPLFVAMDAVGILPLFLGLTLGMSREKRNVLVTQAILTGFGIALSFLILGDLVFKVLGIRPADFQVAGGIVLLILAITDLLFSQEDTRRRPKSSIGIVPIGIPLIMGPAAMTTILNNMHTHGYPLTVASLLINLAIVWILFRNSHYVIKLLGTGGSKAIAKVMSLFLAGIGIKMIRVGIMDFLS